MRGSIKSRKAIQHPHFYSTLRGGPNQRLPGGESSSLNVLCRYIYLGMHVPIYLLRAARELIQNGLEHAPRTPVIRVLLKHPNKLTWDGQQRHRTNGVPFRKGFTTCTYTWSYMYEYLTCDVVPINGDKASFEVILFIHRRDGIKQCRLAPPLLYPSRYKWQLDFSILKPVIARSIGAS